MNTGSEDKQMHNPYFGVDYDEALRMNGLVLGRTIGEGSYGKVKKCHVIDSEEARRIWGNEVKNLACKVIDRATVQKNFLEKFLPREIEILKQIHHENIVTVYKIIIPGEKVFIVMEYVNGGDLLKLLKVHGRLGESRARHIFQQVVEAVSYLHSIHITHRDIKCENILLDSSDNVKLCDFGFARFTYDPETLMETYSTTYCGSAAYAAPEILQGIPYDMKAYDMWSLGCVLYIMIYGMMPFGERNAPRILQKQKDGVKFKTEKFTLYSAALKEVLQGLLELDPDKRMKMSALYKSPWLQENK